jgi:ATP-binding cassette, subfamily B, bacterial
VVYCAPRPLRGGVLGKSEFRVAGEYRYSRRGPARWIVSHALRYPLIPTAVLSFAVAAGVLGSRAPLIVGRAFDHVISEQRNLSTLASLALAYLGLRLAGALLAVATSSANEVLAQRIERDARDELYLALLGKSLTFHGRQRVGDVMARATNDVRQLNFMFSPGLRLILSSGLSLVVPIITIGGIDRRLLLVPLVFTAALVITVRRYSQQLNPAGR